MRTPSSWLAVAALTGALGCGDSATSSTPPDDGQRIASQFERLADSVAGVGYSPTAEALRHAAEIVRLTGHATPVTLTIDGTARSFVAVAEQLDFPQIECRWPADTGIAEPGDSVVGEPGDTVVVPPPDSSGVNPNPGPEPPDTIVTPPPGGGSGEPPNCGVVGTYSMRTLIAWEPERMAEVVRLVADPGSNEVEAGTPDVMVDLPASSAGSSDSATDPDPVPGDSAGGGGGYPGFLGEYLVSDVGSWWAVEGSQSNALLELAGTCSSDRAVFDWAEFECGGARFRFEFDMRVEPLRYDPSPRGGKAPPGGAEGSHTLALGSTQIDGVRLTVIAWTPPPLPPESLTVGSTAARR